MFKDYDVPPYKLHLFNCYNCTRYTPPWGMREGGKTECMTCYQSWGPKEETFQPIPIPWTELR